MAFLISASVLCLVMVAASEPIMRQEKKANVQLHLGSFGEIVSKPMLGDTDTCDDDYPMALKRRFGHRDCNDDHEHRILQRAMCKEAAEEAGTYTDATKFDIVTGNAAPNDYENHHPMGCFKIPCGEANHTTTDKLGYCYFYNPIHDEPTSTSNSTTNKDNSDNHYGVPICYRARFLLGKANTNGGCDAATLPGGYSGYQNIVGPAKSGSSDIDEDQCREAATCLSKCKGDDQTAGQFNPSKNNNSKFDEFPKGCFVSAADGCVYYNAPVPNWVGDGNGNPSNPVGTPLCNVTLTTHDADWPVPGTETIATSSSSATPAPAVVAASSPAAAATPAAASPATPAAASPATPAAASPATAM